MTEAREAFEDGYMDGLRGRHPALPLRGGTGWERAYARGYRRGIEVRAEALRRIRTDDDRPT